MPEPLVVSLLATVLDTEPVGQASVVVVAACAAVVVVAPCAAVVVVTAAGALVGVAIVAGAAGAGLVVGMSRSGRRARRDRWQDHLGRGGGRIRGLRVVAVGGDADPDATADQHQPDREDQNA